MGWKNVKEHYGIDRTVHIEDGNIFVGSGGLPKIIAVAKAGNNREFYKDGSWNLERSGDGIEVWRMPFLGSSGPFDGIVSAFVADLPKLRELMETPDTFERSITVWTCDYYEGTIIEKQCEEPGWPNCTHDGELMYENSFSTSRKEIVKYAKSNAAAGVENMERRVREIEADLAKVKETRDQYAAALKKLEGEA